MRKNYLATLERIRSPKLRKTAEFYWRHRKRHSHFTEFTHETAIPTPELANLRRRLQDQFGWVLEHGERRFTYKLVDITLETATKTKERAARSNEGAKARRRAAKPGAEIYHVTPGSIDEKLNKVFGLWNG